MKLKTEDIVVTMSTLSEVLLTTHVAVNAQPTGLIVMVGTGISIIVLKSKSNTIVPPVNASTTTVGVSVLHESKKLTSNS